MSDNIFVFKNIVHKKNEGISLCLSFIDLKAAFETTYRSVIWEIMPKHLNEHNIAKYTER